jgi:hypothetical protein
MPGAVDPLAVPDERGAADGLLVHDRAAALASLAQRPALVRAVVGDRVERALDVVDADAVPADGQDPVGALGNSLDGADLELPLFRVVAWSGVIRERYLACPYQT